MSSLLDRARNTDPNNTATDGDVSWFPSTREENQTRPGEGVTGVVYETFHSKRKFPSKDSKRPEMQINWKLRGENGQEIIVQGIHQELERQMIEAEKTMVHNKTTAAIVYHGKAKKAGEGKQPARLYVVLTEPTGSNVASLAQPDTATPSNLDKPPF